MGAERYIHSFAPEEQARLIRQARFLAPWTLRHLTLPEGAKVLEVGCGVGAQIAVLQERFPRAHFTGVDIAAPQLERARALLREVIDQGRVDLVEASAFSLPFPDSVFDAVCTFWVLEHLKHHAGVLQEIRRVLKPGGRIYCTEVFNSGLHAWPPQADLDRYWNAFNALQRELGGDPDVGLRLGALLSEAGFLGVELHDASPLLDGRMQDPAARQDFVDFWQTLLLSGAPQLLKHQRITDRDIDGLKAAFRRLRDQPDALFRYEAYQGSGYKPGPLT